MVSKFKVGVIRCSGMGVHHASIFHQLPTTQLTMLAEIQSERLQPGGRELDVTYLCGG
jgi:predicted dehydrogenase